MKFIICVYIYVCPFQSLMGIRSPALAGLYLKFQRKYYLLLVIKKKLNEHDMLVYIHESKGRRMFAHISFPL